MLEELLRTLNNWFEQDGLVGDFKVVGGALLVPKGFLKGGQYIRVLGSTFNDGLHREGETDMVDEEFAGEVRALAIPPAVIALAQEIGAWVKANQKALDGPYASEPPREALRGGERTSETNSTSGGSYEPRRRVQGALRASGEEARG